MASWITDLSQSVSASITQIEKTLDTAVNVAEPGLQAGEDGDTPGVLSWEQRAIAAEQRAEGLLKEGLLLAEKQGKAENALRKARKEKEEADLREKSTSEALQAAMEEKAKLEEELRTLRDIRRRGEESIQQITVSNTEAMRRIDEAKALQVLIPSILARSINNQLIHALRSRPKSASRKCGLSWSALLQKTLSRRNRL